MATKRPIVVEGNTPGKPEKKKSSTEKKKSSSRKTLFKEGECEKGCSSQHREWSEAETSALVQYICLFWEGAWRNTWPKQKDPEFWDACATAVNKTCHSSRSGASCRTRVIKHLAKHFNSLSEAEETLEIDYLKDSFAFGEESSSSTPKKLPSEFDLSSLSPVFNCSPSKKAVPTPSAVGDVVKEFISCFKGMMSSKLKMQLLQHIFKLTVLENDGMEFYKFVNSDFLTSSISAMRNLFSHKKHNLIYNLSRCFEGATPRMSMDRMPYGLLDYNIRFFASTRTQMLGVEDHYASWLESMFAHFGHKWLCLHRGPVWQYEIREREEMLQNHEGQVELVHGDGSQIELVHGDESQVELVQGVGIQVERVQYADGSQVERAHGGGGQAERVHGDGSQVELVHGAGRQVELLHGDGNHVELVHGDGSQVQVVHGDESQVEIDIIGNALLESSLSLDQDVWDDSMETVSRNLSSMFITSGDASTFSSPQFSEDTSLFHVSHLWTNVSDSRREDIESGLVSNQEMEKFHSIRPTRNQISQRNPGMYDPLKSKVNIASLGVREIQKHIASSGFSRTVDVQVEALKQAQASNPQGRWWVKADGCDVRKGLRESMRGTWAGDEDLGDGSLQVMFSNYKSRCAFIKGIGTPARSRLFAADVQHLLFELENDLEFLISGAEIANKAYNKALDAAKSSEHTLMDLAWAAIGFEELVKRARSFQVELHSLVQQVGNGVTANLGSLKSSLLSYLKGLFAKKRIAASHLLVFMIADELRSRKPYAIPVRFLPYKSLTDSKLRELELQLENSMRSIGMTVVGFTTDGEFNSLRTKGNVRPISVIELIKSSRNEAKRTSANTIASFLRLDKHGNPIAQHPAVPLEDVRWLDEYMSNAQAEPVPFERAILILRRKLFPFMHNPHPWVEGRPETTQEALKSIMAIYLYRQKIEDLKQHADPADFSTHLYQPEKGADGELIHHREDHNHLLKRVISRLREGYIPGINLQYLKDALHDPNTGLTYDALTGKNKQSVPDCERLINPGVISFLKRKEHASSARVVQIIHNWHKAVDGRGLSEAQRSSYCKDMKDWLLSDWMPWFQTIPDYSTIDVNRPIKGICGLTQEIVIGLVANIESRELRREEYQERGLPSEHPRASATDDVEGIIALMHEMLGDIFDMKQFLDAQPKILNEFKKRIDPELDFYYWTGANERYRDFELPSFNVPSGVGAVERLDRVTISRRGDPGVFCSDRGSMPQTGGLTKRAQFHKAPVELPPLSTQGDM